MLAWRRKDAKGMCGNCRFHLFKKKKETVMPKAEMYKCSMVKMQPLRDFCGLNYNWIFSAMAGPAVIPCPRCIRAPTLKLR